MSNPQITQCLKDVLPTHSGPFPSQLVSYVDSLYSLSIQKIPSLPYRADVARYHLCAYLGALRCQQRFSLPEPSPQRIPVQPKLLEKLLDDIEDKVVAATRSPSSTPTKKRVMSPAMSPSPSKKNSVPKISSPLKKLQSLKEDKSPKGNNAFEMESPFNPSKKLSNEESPFNTPTKRKLEEASGTPKSPKTPRTPKTQKSAAASPGTPRYIRQLTVADIVSFANNFYIPAQVTPQLVESFMAQRHKFLKKNEWLLACGLVHAAYIRINSKLLERTIGKKTELQDQLFQYQKGGLMKMNMIMWINIIEESVKSEPWIVDLELKYVHNNWSSEDNSKAREVEGKLGKGYELLESFGSMINPSVMFDKPSQVEYYNRWTSRVLEQLEK
ncbi:hypothetical protein FT663_02888 [Candidozyma haemuli var. vulneris]|uniref:ORC6 first cyclin-like domain-containing protein n=1 Tax=Candidozyma haemuli TaxID=45357 RepID=A0A2V1AUG6_9ASCO|nr:hypothetical protein CXQ85_000720 [[Candida] haemuloni]KAF3989223.1 hypothetical protein FT662_02966 [[Candida] haemuloni var. vulneris]KAF3991103.1 hypothetical protein FT663_02888 [[Candida] haemuloni var. vulneris]PVH21730.1 hypothetical protein CXQ85_000720 [[Candida] haemuloni]